MKRTILILTMLLLSLGANERFNLTVDVQGLKNQKGVVLVNLYNKEGTIPDKNFTKYFKKEIVPITGSSVKVTFKNLPKGRYAVGVLHDENGDGKVEKGFMLPKEGVGFSNFSSISPFNKPNFKKASFMLDKDKSIKVKMIYF